MASHQGLLILMALALMAGAAGGMEQEMTKTSTAQRLTLAAEPVHEIGQLAREPMVVAHPDGTLFLAGFGSKVTGVDPNKPPLLWKSTDGGLQWTPVAVGNAEDGARGNSDVDLAIGPDGALYFVTMGFDRSTFEGTHITVGVSHDAGENWDWTVLSETRGDDRPWVAVAPDGTAHVVWNDGKGVNHASSTDGGQRWTRTDKRVFDVGGSSHLAVGPEGMLAVRITPISASGRQFDEGVDKVAVSTDKGRSWVLHDAPGQLVWDPTFQQPGVIPRWVEPVAWDAQGALYSLWSEGTNVRLARSTDRGASWAIHEVADDQMAAFFPYLVAQPSGELAATWFTGNRQEDSLFVNVAHFSATASADAAPRIVRAEPFVPETWQDRVDVKARDTAGEYVPVLFLPDGTLGVATPVQDAHNDRYGFTWWRFEVE